MEDFTLIGKAKDVFKLIDEMVKEEALENKFGYKLHKLEPEDFSMDYVHRPDDESFKRGEY